MLALQKLQREKLLTEDPFKHKIAAISVGMYQGTPVLDLDYKADSNAETDMNIVMNDQNGFIEIRGTAEGKAFQYEEQDAMVKLAQAGIEELFQLQEKAIS